MPNSTSTYAKVTQNEPHKVTQNSAPKVTQKVTHNVLPSGSGFLTVYDVASILGKSHDTIKRWCAGGKLPAIPKRYGKKTTYLIPQAAIPMLTAGVERTASNGPQSESLHESPNVTTNVPSPHASYFDSWVLAMQKGLMTGKPFSPLTVTDYETFVRDFLKYRPTVSYGALRDAMLDIPSDGYAKRFKLYKGVVCFAKFLIRERVLDESFLADVKPLFPKRHAPPKWPGLDESQFTKLVEVADTPFKRMMLAVLGGTGVRAGEAVALRWNDIDFERHTLTVRRGKGNKTRTLGMTSVVESALEAYKHETLGAPGGWLFLDKDGAKMTRSALYHRLRLLGKRVGIVVSPHALRRTFVTINANKGRPLQMLQIACGHSDIKTTRGYCLTTEQEVIEAMRGWD